MQHELIYLVLLSESIMDVTRSVGSGQDVSIKSNGTNARKVDLWDCLADERTTAVIATQLRQTQSHNAASTSRLASVCANLSIAPS